MENRDAGLKREWWLAPAWISEARRCCVYTPN